MNWEAIGAIGQMVGAIAVVISLIYLAREIRRNARLARQSSVDTLNGWLGQLAQHPHLAQLFDRGIRDLKSLEGADRISFEALMLQWFHVFAEMYHQQLEGQLDPRLWHEVETPMRDLINAQPGIQAWWRLYSKWFGEEFVNYVNQPGKLTQTDSAQPTRALAFRLQQVDKRPSLYRKANSDQ